MYFSFRFIVFHARYESKRRACFYQGNKLNYIDMRKKEIMNLIAEAEVGKDLRLIPTDKSEELRLRNNIKRAQLFGYKLVFTKLYDNVFYFEKLKEGNKEELIRDSLKNNR